MKKIITGLLCILMIGLLPTTGYANSTSESSQTAAAASSASERAISVNASLSATTLCFDITERITAETATEGDPTLLTYSSLTIRNKMPTGKLEVEKLELTGSNDYTIANDASTEWSKLSIKDKKLSMLVSCGTDVSSHDMSSPLTRRLELANNGSITYTFSGHTGISSGYAGDIAQLVVTVSLKEFEPTALKISGTGVTFKIAQKKWDGTLQTSTDGVNWTNYSAGTTVSCGSENTIYVRGMSNTIITGSKNQDTAKLVIGGTNVSVSGDLDALLDYKTVGMGKKVTSKQGAFSSLFKDCSSITDASALIISGDSMESKNYAELFNNCKNLKSAPALPATTLADSCYAYMFSNCTSLENAPALPATTLARGCYESMFSNCTSLKSAPALPATTLADSCYAYMFSNCTSLKSAPALPATTLARGCYLNMFYYCTSLENATALPATILSDECYSEMFSYCKQLKTIPKLPATTLANSCYYQMFYACELLRFSLYQDGEYRNEVLNLTSKKLKQDGLPTDAVKWMFIGTSGRYADDPEYGYVYYTSNDILV